MDAVPDDAEDVGPASVLRGPFLVNILHVHYIYVKCVRFVCVYVACVAYTTFCAASPVVILFSKKYHVWVNFRKMSI